MIRILEDGIDGYLHEPERAPDAAIVLTHGAGSNCGSPLLLAMAEAFVAMSVAVLRCDLPFRQRRRSGPPFPAQAEADREGLRKAVEALRKRFDCEIFLGGHSYGGRQASILAAESPGLVSSLLLLSYPLHPPEKPAQLRTGHFGSLTTPVVFVHGTKDPFGTIAEMEQAMELIPAKKWLLPLEGAGHDLKRGKIPAQEIAQMVNSGSGLPCKDPLQRRRDTRPASD